MTSITRLREDMQDEIQDQIDALRQEVSDLKKSAARRGDKVYRQGRNAGNEMGEALRDYAESVVPDIRRSVRRARRSARSHPVTSATAATVGLLAIGLTLSLLLRR